MYKYTFYYTSKTNETQWEITLSHHNRFNDKTFRKICEDAIIYAINKEKEKHNIYSKSPNPFFILEYLELKKFENITKKSVCNFFYFSDDPNNINEEIHDKNFINFFKENWKNFIDENSDNINHQKIEVSMFKYLNKYEEKKKDFKNRLIFH